MEKRMAKIQAILEERHIPYDYHEEDGCGSIDFMFRGLSYHIWEYEDNGVYGAETNIFWAGRSQDVDGDYDTIISDEMKTWPLMIAP